MKRKSLNKVLSILMILGLSACGGQSSDSEVPSRPDAEMATEVYQGANIEEDVGNEISTHRRNAITRAVERASPSIVSIVVTTVVDRPEDPRDEFFRYFFGDRMPRENTNMGSGFLINKDGHIVTNQHVVGSNPSEIMISTTYGETYEAKLIGSDELTDLALLKINSDDVDKEFPYIDFSDSDSVMVGEWAIALGNPFGLFDDGKPTVTVGVVSAKNRDFNPDPSNRRVYIDMIQTDAAINRGNSGGPLLNSEGKVIGINTFIYTGGSSSGFVGLGFAIPSNRVGQIITQLQTSGTVALKHHPGMEFTSMTEQLVYRYRLPYVQGLLVTSVNKDGPAYDCGIMPGDVILKLGDERVLSEMHARALLREFNEGDLMSVELLRENEHYETEMLLRKKVTDPGSYSPN